MSYIGCCYGLPMDDLIEFLMSARVYSNHEHQSVSRAMVYKMLPSICTEN